jgi:hypothetical protein
VEIDTFAFGGEAPEDHIAVHSDGNSGNCNDDSCALSPGPKRFPSDLNNSVDHLMRLSYRPGTLDIFIDNLNLPFLTVPLNLQSVRGANLLDENGQAWVGFTAGTGAGRQNHDLVAWTIQSVPEPSGLLLTVSGGLVLFVRRRRLCGSLAASQEK